MLGNWTLSLFVITIFILIVWYISQQKFRNKMLIYYLRPNKTRIKKWVPLSSKYVRFDTGKWGNKQAKRCNVNSKCIILEWYEGGINRFFPVLIPTMEFRWDTPDPMNPENFEVTWQSPELNDAAFQEHNFRAFSKANYEQMRGKSKYPEWLLPAMMAAVVLLFMYLFWQMNNSIADLERLVITGG